MSQGKFHVLAGGKAPFQHPGSVGYNLYVREGCTLHFMEYGEIPMGIIATPPSEFYWMLVPRSSLFKNKGLVQTNSVGIVDPNYNGPADEIKMPVLCLRQGETEIYAGESLCQLVLMPLWGSEIAITDTIPPKGISRGGFGSTGGYDKGQGKFADLRQQPMYPLTEEFHYESLPMVEHDGVIG